MGHLLNMSLKGKSTAGVATVNWSHGYSAICATRSWTVSKNGVVQASGNGDTYVSGSFTVANGDTISMSSTSGVSGAACQDATVSIFRDATVVATDTQTGLNVTATASWTIATVAATYTIQGGDIV